MARTRNPWLGPAARPVAVPEDVDDPRLEKASGQVELPFHIRWSEPYLTYDLARRPHRLRVYEQVLREGTEDDVRFYVDVDQLLDLFDELVLPPTVRRAWVDWFRRHRGTELDLGSDARILPVDRGPGFPVLSGEELAVDKVLAVFGRAEPRDFADLVAVVDRYGLDRLFDLAAEKDSGFDPGVFAEMADRFTRLPREEFLLDDDGYSELSRAVSGWRARAVELARSNQPRRHLGPDRGPDLGLGL